MPMKTLRNTRKKAAKSFANYWKDKGYEKGESQPFWINLLQDVFDIEDAIEYISFEDKVHLDRTSFIDGYIKKTHVLIEQKSSGKPLNKPIHQSDGSKLTPFQQAQRYSANLPYSERPRWIVTCNFQQFFVYDMEQPNSEPSVIELAELPSEYYRLEFLVDETSKNAQKETEVSLL